MEIFMLLIGLAVGFLVGYALARSGTGRETARLQAQMEERDSRLRETQNELAKKETVLQQASDRRIVLETRLAGIDVELREVRQQTEEKLAVLNEARTRFEETFKALAGETLRHNSESFIQLARSQMEAILIQTDNNLERRQEAIGKVIAPLSETLKRYEEQLRAIEKTRADDGGGLREQIALMMKGHKDLENQTGNLVNALRLPQTRGRWGELTLHRTCELAGMTQHCDFSEQVSRQTDDGRLKRPDMIVHLPAGRDIIVDAKVSLKAYMEAVESPTDEVHMERMREHARQVRAHMDSLASQEYSRQFEKAPEFTVLFLPGEPFFSAAIQHDPDLFEDAMKRGIIIATPTTLVSLLKTVAYGWRQASIEQNARKISETGQELYDRVTTVLKHLSEVGSAIRRSVDCYNKAIGSINARLLPHARRLKDLGATSATDLQALEPLSEFPRPPGLVEDTASNVDIQPDVD